MLAAKTHERPSLGSYQSMQMSWFMAEAKCYASYSRNVGFPAFACISSQCRMTGVHVTVDRGLLHIRVLTDPSSSVQEQGQLDRSNRSHVTTFGIVMTFGPLRVLQHLLGVK